MGDSDLTPRLAERRNYPGLLPAEADLFRGWLREHEGHFERYSLNVRVGDGIDPGPSYPEAVRKAAILNSQRRIDAVAYRGDSPTIIEVKERAGGSALGQLLLYSSMFRAEHPGMPAPSLLLVTGAIDDVVLAVCRQNGIEVHRARPARV